MATEPGLALLRRRQKTSNDFHTKAARRRTTAASTTTPEASRWATKPSPAQRRRQPSAALAIRLSIYHPQPQLEEIRRFNGFGAADAHQQQQRAAAEAAGAHQQQQQRAAAEAGRQREMDVRLNAMDMKMKNMNDAVRQLIDHLPAATPSEGSSEDSAASLPSMETPAADSLPFPVETPVLSFAALLPSSPPAVFVRATPPEPPPEHRPPTPEERHPPTPEAGGAPPAAAGGDAPHKRAGALGSDAVVGRDYEAHAAPIVPKSKDQFKDIASPRFGPNWKTDLDPAKLGPWLSRLGGRLIAHDVRLGPVLDLGEHACFNLTSTNDAQAAWYIKANLWVGGQIVDQFDATSKRVDNFFSTNA